MLNLVFLILDIIQQQDINNGVIIVFLRIRAGKREVTLPVTYKNDYFPTSTVDDHDDYGVEANSVYKINLNTIGILNAINMQTFEVPTTIIIIGY